MTPNHSNHKSAENSHHKYFPDLFADPLTQAHKNRSKSSEPFKRARSATLRRLQILSARSRTEILENKKERLENSKKNETLSNIDPSRLFYLTTKYLRKHEIESDMEILNDSSVKDFEVKFITKPKHREFMDLFYDATQKKYQYYCASRPIKNAPVQAESIENSENFSKKETPLNSPDKNKPKKEMHTKSIKKMSIGINNC